MPARVPAPLVAKQGIEPRGSRPEVYLECLKQGVLFRLPCLKDTISKGDVTAGMDL